MTALIKIVSLSLIDTPATNGKSEILASFAFEYSGMRFNDCALLRFSNGNLRAFPPRVSGLSAGAHHPVVVIDDGLRAALTAAAVRTYRAFGGTHDAI